LTPNTVTRPLVAKLGFKAGHRIRTVNPPPGYLDLVAPIPDDVSISDDLSAPLDAVHLFTASRGELEHLMPILLSEIKQGGAIWISWPKKSSGVPSEISEDDIRAVALPLGLVDVKVCAVDPVWSGLKLVIRKENRRQGK
jgi:hypothetical protein